jgi:quercetin dioxygenase-like cupin family protein
MTDEPETWATYKANVDAALTASGVANKPIVLSTEITIPTLTDSQGVDRTPIAWPLYENGHKMFYVTRVKPGTHIKPHSHNEDVFRHIVSGSLDIIVNNHTYTVTQGMWFLIKAGTPYEVYADKTNGYIALAGYRFMCETARRLSECDS